MDEQKIARINELYHKSKAEGLTAKERRNSSFSGENILMLLSGISAVSLTRSLSRKWMEALRTWVRNSETRKDKKTMIGLPKDPVLLLSVVNTKLRDRYLTLDDLCEDMQADKDEITNN